jgi:phosphocarrier protein
MLSRKIVINNPSGLHARPAHNFVTLVKKFKSDVLLHVGEKDIKCESIINLLLAAIKKGTVVELKVTGEDEDEAMLKISEFLEGLAE